MKLSATALALLAAVPAVLAGLEDAKYSTVLSAKNFDGVIASQSEGTLVAFFAPWCGHCKSLEPVWTKIASAFDGDDRCKVAHFDADDAAARPLASKYGVSGFPTIKFIHPPSKGGQVEAYSGPRTEEAFLEFLNEKCGTHKLPGGLLSDLAGRIPSLDSLASLYLVPTATRPDLLSSASALASSLASSSSPLAGYYVKIMTKLDSLPNVEEAKAWIERERARLAKLAAKKGSVTAQKIDEARMKSNV
ncbi:thioredoxin-domain-containing protein, partial [Rhodotorula sp. JG-1b]